MSILLSLLLGKSFGALKAIGGAIGKYPLPSALVILSLFCVFQTWQKNRVTAERNAVRAELQRTIAAYTTAQTLARNDAIKERAAIEQQYKDNADATDRSYQQRLADAQAATDRYVRTHPVPVCGVPSSAADPSPTRAPVAAADDHPAVIPAAVPAGAVVVSADDVRACTAAVDYALAAHDWALKLAAQSMP